MFAIFTSETEIDNETEIEKGMLGRQVTDNGSKSALHRHQPDTRRKGTCNASWEMQLVLIRLLLMRAPTEKPIGIGRGLGETESSHGA